MTLIEYSTPSDDTQSPADPKGAIYSTVCHVNHSCAPTAAYVWQEKNGVETVHAMRDVPTGEEITVRYTDRYLKKCAREQQLRDSFGLKCVCPSAKTLIFRPRTKLSGSLRSWKCRL